MKKLLFLFVGVCLLGISLGAQNSVNLVIFSEDGDPFYAFVNGIKQNQKPETNVKITGISPNVALRIEFENKALPQLKQNMSLDVGFEHTARIKRDNKKQLKLRYFGSVPIAEAAPGVPTVQYNTTSSDENSNTNVSTPQGNSSVNTEVNSSGSVNTQINTPEGQMNSNTTVTSSTTTTTNGNPQNGNVSINMGGMGVNMNVNMSGMDMNGTTTTTTSKTVTTTHSSSSSGGGNWQEPAPSKSQVTQTPAPSKGGCYVAMAPGNFATMKKNVESKPFSDTKMSTAKLATKNACLSTAQVKEICKLFSMDDDKLTYAKYAYDYCVDKANFYTVSEVFSFSTTTDDFNQFLESK